MSDLDTAKALRVAADFIDKHWSRAWVPSFTEQLRNHADRMDGQEELARQAFEIEREILNRTEDHNVNTWDEIVEEFPEWRDARLASARFLRDRYRNEATK